jgi:hypothetical protein
VEADKYMERIDLPSSFLCSAAILTVFMTLLLVLRREGYSDAVQVRGAATKSNFSAARERLALNQDHRRGESFNLSTTTTRLNELPLNDSGAGSHASITLFIPLAELHLPLFTF